VAMLNKRHLARTLAVAMLFAAAGFSYAVSTGSRGTGGDGAEAGTRVVGSSTLRFTNALLIDNPAPTLDVFDLGDACFGSMVTRYITVAGGLRPYSVAAVDLNNFLPLTSSLSLNSSGLLMGTVARPAGLGAGNANLNFIVSAGDSALVSANPNANQAGFTLTMVTCDPNIFRFAVDRINNGVVGQSYTSKLEVLGGDGPVTFSVVPNTLTLDGTPKGNVGGLEAIGLSLSNDGTIVGRPLQAGAVQFTARATDRQSPIRGVALDRSNTVQDQVVTFIIEDNPITSSDYITLSCSVKGDIGKLNKDSIKFSGNVNLSGGAFNSLNGALLKFVIGGASFTGRFNDKGQAESVRGGPLVFADGTRMSVSVNPRTGQMTGSITNASLGVALDGANIANRSTRRYGVAFHIGSAVVGSDLIEFATKRSGNKFQLTYKLGKFGQPLGGAFQLVNVKGKDSATVAGNDGVAWAVKFIAVPRFGVDANAGLDAISSINVRIGNRFDQKINSQFLVSTPSGNTSLIKNNLKGETVSKLTLNSRNFVGTVTTQPLSVFSTGIFAAHSAQGATNFPFGLDVVRTTGNAPFTGEVAKRIIPNAGKGYWTDQHNLRK
jgi:hypothetical protein